MVQLGQVRDLDVLHADVVAPVLATLNKKQRSTHQPALMTLITALHQQQQHARKQALALLDSPAYGHTLLTTLQSLHQQETARISPLNISLPRLAAIRMHRKGKHVSRRIRAVHYDNPISLHDLRIAIKRLRYALDFFSSLIIPVPAAIF